MIYQEIINDYHFWEWLKQSDSYNNNFSLQGAKALQAYLEELSDELGEDISFDPIAWCVEYSEYPNHEVAYREHYGDDKDLPVEQRRTDTEQIKEYFEDNTTVIEFNGGLIVQDF